MKNAKKKSDFSEDLIEPYDDDWNPPKKNEWNTFGLTKVKDDWDDDDDDDDDGDDWSEEVLDESINDIDDDDDDGDDWSGDDFEDDDEDDDDWSGDDFEDDDDDW